MRVRYRNFVGRVEHNLDNNMWTIRTDKFSVSSHTYALAVENFKKEIDGG